jgi:hypothetical protein
MGLISAELQSYFIRHPSNSHQRLQSLNSEGLLSPSHRLEQLCEEIRYDHAKTSLDILQGKAFSS